MTESLDFPKIKRPWQGTLLAVVFFIFMVGCLSTILGFVFFDELSSELNGLTVVVFVLLAILGFFIGLGFLRGQRWEIILFGSLVVLFLLGGVFGLIAGESGMLGGMLINGFALYLIIATRKNPFYKKRSRQQLSAMATEQ